MAAFGSKYDALISEVVSDFSKLEKRVFHWRKTDRLRRYFISELHSPNGFYIEIGEDEIEVGLAFLPTPKFGPELQGSAHILQQRIERRGSRFHEGAIEFYTEGPTLYRYAFSHAQPLSVDGLVRDLRFFSDLFEILDRANKDKLQDVS